MNTEEQPDLLIDIDDGLARLTINRPHRMNTLSRGLQAMLRKAFFDLSEDHTVRVILLSAVGDRAFCAGADLKEPGRHEYNDLASYLADQPGLFDIMRRCPQIIVSAVNGWAVGGGMMMPLFSDLTYASANAKFQLPQVSLGIMTPYGASIRLARQIGHGRAMDMLLLGSTMNADEAHSCGLIQGVSPDTDALREKVEEVIAKLMALPAQSLAMTKSSLTTGWDMSVEAAATADRFRDYALKQSPASKQIHADWSSAHS